ALTGNVTGNLTGNVTGDVTGDVTGTVSSISNHTTDELVEGSNNLYFTDVRAQNAITVTNAGGDGSLAYSAGTITYTGPNASDIQSYFSAGTGVSISSGTISIGQAVGTSNDVVFNNVTSDLTGAVTGDLTGSVTGNVTGDLTGDVTGNITGSSGDFTTLSAVTISDGTASLSSGSLSGVTDIVTTGNITAGGDLTVLSDARLKANIVSLGSTLSKLLLIDGKSYTMKKDNKQKIGVLAQDIEKVFPELVSETDGIKSVNYQGLVPVLINALKEQEAKFEEQQKRLERLEQLVAQLD
ncbi:MAG TPA: tail fiber domain-containing protein, partial [Flavobacteriaceae bacterium]|nr:tail fiber domain-containing protein [Flavobacteriaceae bacterium]